MPTRSDCGSPDVEVLEHLAATACRSTAAGAIEATSTLDEVVASMLARQAVGVGVLFVIHEATAWLAAAASSATPAAVWAMARVCEPSSVVSV